MSARPLTEAVQQAEQAISGGEYELAVETCRRVLGQFPEFATAHRLLGEAYLEQGSPPQAERAFFETLQRDPQSVPAYVGLGTIALQRGELQTALAYYQASWEIAPQRADARDRLVQVAQQLYGPDGRLHPTRAALVSLHFEAGRWSRVVAEANAVLEEHPSRMDVRLRLAEALWRRGDDEAAAAVCQFVLERAPLAVVALLMLADIERRRGRQEAAQSLLSRARSIDPDGVRAADLIAVGSEDLAAFLLPETPAVLDDSAQPAGEISMPRIAPAPDFTVSADAAPSSTAEPAASDDQPDAGHEPAAVSLDISLPTQEEIDAARPTTSPQAGFTDILRSFEVEGLTPFAFEESGEVVDVDQSSEDLAETGEPMAEPTIDALDQPGSDSFSLASLFDASDEPIEDAPQTAEAVPVWEATIEPAADLSSLTSDWDSIDREIQNAIPDELPAGYTDELRLLDATGMEPFSIEGEPGIQPLERAPEPEPEAQSATIEAQPAASPAMDWDALDRELQAAIPGEVPAGYTDELEQVAQAGIEPFAVDEAADWLQPIGEVLPEGAEPVGEPDQSVSALFDTIEPEVRAMPAEMPQIESGLSEDDLRILGAVESAGRDWPELASDSSDEANWFTQVETEPASWESAVVVEAEAEPGAAPATARPGGDDLRAAIRRLGVDQSLFDRARSARQELIAAGRLSGERYLPGTEPKGPTLESVEAALSEAPEDVEQRVLYAGLLVADGQRDRALEQFRWLYRRGAELDGETLGRLGDVGQGEDATAIGAQRLLGALYRRAGNFGLSASCYSLSLETSRRLRTKGV